MILSEFTTIKKKKELSIKPKIDPDKQRVKSKINKLSRENLIFIEKKVDQLLK